MNERFAYQKWYGSQRWRNRAKLQLKLEPLCAMCLLQNKVVPAIAADHVEAHRGNEMSFWYGPLQSLCETHHNRTKQQIETRGFSTEIDASGFPVDPRHPFNRVK